VLVTVLILAAVGFLFVLMLAFAEAGRRIGRARLARNPELPTGIGVAEGALFGLLGLLLAFTFSGAASRFVDRRDLINEETNAIGTAYLRVDLLPADAQPEIRELFRRYVDVRAIVYRDSEDRALTESRFAEGVALQEEIWTKATAACLGPDAPPQAAILLLPALNAMIDITTSRVSANRNHPPPILYALLVLLSLIGSLLVGYASSPNKERSWLHTMVFATLLSVTLYVIVDLEFPRFGLIRVHAADQLLLELRQTMK
jgi:hypothetical protein